MEKISKATHDGIAGCQTTIEIIETNTKAPAIKKEALNISFSSPRRVNEVVFDPHALPKPVPLFCTSMSAIKIADKTACNIKRNVSMCLNYTRVAT